MRKRILVISNMYPSQKDPYYGTFVKVFYENLCQVTSYEVSLITIYGQKKNIFQKCVAYLRFYIEILFKVTIFQYDLIYTHTISHPTPPLRIISFFKKLNTIYNIHGDDLLTTTKFSARLLKFSAPLLKEAYCIVVPTLYFKDVLLDRMPWLSSKMIFISPSGGVSNDFFSKTVPKNSTPILGYVSRIDEGKGWDTMLDAYKLLYDWGIKFQAKIYGRGLQVEQLMLRIREYGLSEIVSYLGPKSHDELPKIYNSFDVFVFPTIREAESLGLVGLEAMAASTPVIGSAIGGVKSYVNHGINGYLFVPGDYSDLALHILKYIQLDTSDKCKFRDQAYNTAINYESRFVNANMVQMINKALEYYDEKN